jgi:propionyl-CoA carboxylase beta chain
MSEPATTSAPNHLAELDRRNALAEDGGGPERRERQHREGKLAARERVLLLLDDNSFEETDKFVTHLSTDFGMGAADKRILG